jgi:hypothetical protein
MMSDTGIITCPACGAETSEVIPTDSCLFFFDCPSCDTHLRPLPGDCCVFCSYGDRRCPSRTSDEGPASIP